MSLSPPVFPVTLGVGVSADPGVVDLLAKNDQLYLEQFAFYNAVVNFLNRFRDWKTDSQARVGNGMPIEPAPVPPVGYTIVPDPPKPAPPPPNFTPIVGDPATFPGRPTFYPAPADNNPAGTIIANPFKTGGRLIRVVQSTPFGNAQYWEELP